MRNIIVAGAGHGGLTAAAYLADKGYNVEVYEKQRREDMGYDWHDTMNNQTFNYAGIVSYDKADVHNRKDSTFYASPSLRTPISFDIDADKVDLEIDRKVLYNYLIANAEAKGVKMFYQKNVQSPLIDKDNNVVGLVIDNEEKRADMVIDSAGMNSPVRTNLPSNYNIMKSIKDSDTFHTYRAYYNLIDGAEIINKDRFNIYFMFNGIKGITWYKICEGKADILIGSIEPIDMDLVDKVLMEFRKVQPSIGYEVLRGGYIKNIPLKSTLSLIVGNNYAAVGDTVSMPIPLNGSGITNSIIAGKLLAETIINIDTLNKTPQYTLANLWDYQVKYYQKIADKMIYIAIIKNCLLSYSPKVIDFFFNSGVLTSYELSAGPNGKDIILDRKGTIEKLKRGYKRPISLIKLKLAVKKAKCAKLLAQSIPAVYDKVIVDQWRKKIDSFT